MEIAARASLNILSPSAAASKSAEAIRIARSTMLVKIQVISASHILTFHAYYGCIFVKLVNSSDWTQMREDKERRIFSGSLCIVSSAAMQLFWLG